MTTITMRAILLCAGLSLLASSAAHAASTDAAMDADLHKLELQWEQVKFQEDGQPQQFDDMAAVAKQASAIAARYPGRAEPLIWEGIATSEEAGLASMLHAMGYAKDARRILERQTASIRRLSMGVLPLASAFSTIVCRVFRWASVIRTRRVSFSSRPFRWRPMAWMPITSMLTS